MSPANTLTESTHRENVTNGDDAVLSSTQLSKSIDMLMVLPPPGDNDDSQSARLPLTSVARFPRCQYHFAAHGNLTFPLIFENDLAVAHIENISMHDLLNALKNRIKAEENINKINNMMLKIENKCSGEHRWIKGDDQWMRGIDKKCTLVHFDQKFPLKIKKIKSQQLLKFPCTSMEKVPRFDLQNELSCITRHGFPLKLKKSLKKFPICCESNKSCSYEIHLKQSLNFRCLELQKIRKDFEANKKKGYFLNFKEKLFYKNSGKRGNENIQTEFPLIIKKKWDTNKFPVQAEVNVKNNENTGDVILKESVTFAQNTSPHIGNIFATIVFPARLKLSNKKFPLDDKAQLTTLKLRKLQLNPISKSVQDTKKIMYLIGTTEPINKFPSKNLKVQTPLKKFPLKIYQSTKQIPSKSNIFPIKFQQTKIKFPINDSGKAVDLSLISKDIKHKFDCNKITKTLQESYKPNTKILQEPEERGKIQTTFPPGNHRGHSHNRDLNIKFPLNHISSATFYFKLIEKDSVTSLITTSPNRTNLKRALKFPMKVCQSINLQQFPFEHKNKERILNLSFSELKEKFQNTRFHKSLQKNKYFYDIISMKAVGKFPLKERVVKKFYRKFPNEKDIPVPLCEKVAPKHNQNFNDHLNISHIPNNNVNNFTTTKTILDKQAISSMTPDFYKHHENSLNADNDDDNEKYASQVHVEENLFATSKTIRKTLIPRPVQYKKPKALLTTHNVVGKDLKILPTIEAKNIFLTTTKTAREVGQYAEENIERHDALINIRDSNNDSVSLASIGTTLSQNIINSSFNHRHECDIGSGSGSGSGIDSILRASTPPTSAITSVQNTTTKRHHNTLYGGEYADLSNPQVAQIAERSSEVRDTFNTTVVSGGGSSRFKLSTTGSILDKNQNESLPTSSLGLTSLPSDLPPSHFIKNVYGVASAYDSTSSLEEKIKNCSNSSELLPKYSLLELCDNNVTNCPHRDHIEIKGIKTDHIICQDKNEERVVIKSQEIIEKQVADKINDKNKNFEFYDKYDQELLENLVNEKLSDFQIEIDDSIEIDEMKLEMQRSKGALPNTAPTSGVRNVGKSVESVSTTSHDRSKPYANSTSSKVSSNRIASGTPQSTVHRSTPTPPKDINSIGTRSYNDRLSSTTSNSILTRPSTATHRLSNDLSSSTAIPSYSPLSRSSSSGSPSSSNYVGNSGVSSSAANRYHNENSSSVSTPATPKLKYTRRPTSGAILSLDLTSYTPDTESSVNTAGLLNRGVSLDTTSSTDLYPERTRLRRQRRFRSQNSQDEDPIERLNRLKAQISASLSEVKGVLKHYNADEGENQNLKQKTGFATSLKVPTPRLLENVKEDISNEEQEKETPVAFRFVKKIRRRSFFDEDGNEGQKDNGSDEVDRSAPINEMGIDEVDKCVRQQEIIESKEPSETPKIQEESMTQVKLETATKAGKLTESISTPEESMTLVKLETATKTDPLTESITKPALKIEESGLQNHNVALQKSVSPISDRVLQKDIQSNDEIQQEKNQIDLIKSGEIKINEKLENENVLVEDKKSEKLQLDLTESKDSKQVNEDKKESDKTKKPMKKNQVNKVKPIKNANQGHETPKGKIVSKIPQRIEKGKKVNDSKLEIKAIESKSVEKVENNENHVLKESLVETSDNKNKLNELKATEPDKQKEMIVSKNETSSDDKYQEHVVKEKHKAGNTHQILDTFVAQKNNIVNQEPSPQTNKEIKENQHIQTASRGESSNKPIDKSLETKGQAHFEKVINKADNPHEVEISSILKKDNKVEQKTKAETATVPIEDSRRKHEFSSKANSLEHHLKDIDKKENNKKANKESSPRPFKDENVISNQIKIDENKTPINDPTKLKSPAEQAEINNSNKVKNEISPTSTKLNNDKMNRDISPKSNSGTITVSANTLRSLKNFKDVAPLLSDSIKPLIKIEDVAVHDPQVLDNIQPTPVATEHTKHEASVELRQKLCTKPRDPLRRASLAAVEGSKIEPPVHLATPGKIQRRPSDSEAVVKKKLITTKTTTSGSIEEVTPKPKIVKVKKSPSPKKPPSIAINNDTCHQLAATQVVQNLTNNRDDQQMKEAATPLGAIKTIQGDKNKDVTMPNVEMPTQMPQKTHTLPNNTTKALVGQNNRTQLMINEASIEHPPSSLSLTSKPIELDASSSTATIENALATTTNREAIQFENSEGGAMLANSNQNVVSSAAASAANGPKDAIISQQDLHDLLQQESIVFIKTSQNISNELKTEKNQNETNAHIIRPTNLEVSTKQLGEPLELTQQQVVKTTDIKEKKSNDDIGHDQATNIESIQSAAIKSSPSITANQQPQQEQQQQQNIAPTTTTTKIEEKATTKANDSPLNSISSEEATIKNTTHSKDITHSNLLLSSIPTPDVTNSQSESQGLDKSGIMPELQVTPAPVQTAEVPHGHLKKKVIIKKIIRQNSVDKVKKIEEKTAALTEESVVIPQIDLDKCTDDLVATVEELTEASEQSTEEASSQSEAAVEVIKPKKVRKVKKKVIIKRQKRRLSVSGDSFFNHEPTAEEESVNNEVETLEKPIAFVSDEEPEDEPESEVIEEIKPLKPCINKKEFEIGDEVLFGERVKRTQIKWRKGRVKERTSCISYLLDIDGTEVSSHVNYLKKYTNRKVNFGGKEYLEIDYEQLAEDEERAERVKQRTFSIWNMV